MGCLEALVGLAFLELHVHYRGDFMNFNVLIDSLF